MLDIFQVVRLMVAPQIVGQASKVRIRTEEVRGVVLAVSIDQQHSFFVVGGEDCRQVDARDGFPNAAFQV